MSSTSGEMLDVLQKEALKEKRKIEEMHNTLQKEATKEIRHKYITREEGVNLVHKYDHEFPEKYFKDFLSYINTSEEKFYETLDKFRPSHLWGKKGNDFRICKNWHLKHKVK